MKPILVFVATAYALSIALSLVVGLTGGHESALIGLAYLSMFLPAVSVVIVSATMNEPPRVRWNHFPPRYLPIALFLIPVVQHGGVALYGDGARRNTAAGLADTAERRSLSYGSFTRMVCGNDPGLLGRIALNAVVGLAANGS